jgi:KDO2-lipid IV(A) lauroyltransferase
LQDLSSLSLKRVNWEAIYSKDEGNDGMSLKSNGIKFLVWISRPGIAASVLAFIFRGVLRLVPIRKKIAEQNLEIALPGKTPKERKKILWKTYDNLVWLGLEFAALQRDPNMVLDWVEAENTEYLDDKVGGIILPCHVGNGELVGTWIAQSGHKLTAIYRESSDLDEREIMEKMHTRINMNIISSTAPMARALSVLRRGEFLMILPDQHGGGEGIKVPLFGLETSTSRGTAVFAYLTKKPILPVFIRRISPFKHKMRVEKPLEWENSGNREETIYKITCGINKIVEQVILETPDQWLAQHKRFKEHY